MQLIIVTGMSGGGKSIAIRQLEDCGYYCIDNLPAAFLLPVAQDLRTHGIKSAAVAIDARSQSTFDGSLKAIRQLEEAGFDVRILFLTASDQELVKRFSETRRRHPLSTLAASRDQLVTLQEAISRERDLLAPISAGAALMDTTGILSSQLREWVKKFVGQPQAMMTLTFESFAFKHGLPVASDLVFDVRCLPNPYYDPALRPLTGRDKPVADYLRTFPTVINMVDDIEGFIRKWLPAYIAQNRHYLTVAVGCTGGQHRSVFVGRRARRPLQGHGRRRRATPHHRAEGPAVGREVRPERRQLIQKIRKAGDGSPAPPCRSSAASPPASAFPPTPFPFLREARSPRGRTPAPDRRPRNE